MDPFSRLFVFSPMKDKTFTKLMYSQKHFRVSGIKIRNVVTKKTSQILLQTLWQSINQRLYLTSNLLIAKLLISPKKINL